MLYVIGFAFCLGVTAVQIDAISGAFRLPEAMEGTVNTVNSIGSVLTLVSVLFLQGRVKKSVILSASGLAPHLQAGSAEAFSIGLQLGRRLPWRKQSAAGRLSANPGLSPLSHVPCQAFLHDLLIFYFATGLLVGKVDLLFCGKATPALGDVPLACRQEPAFKSTIPQYPYQAKTPSEIGWCFCL